MAATRRRAWGIGEEGGDAAAYAAKEEREEDEESKSVCKDLIYSFSCVSRLVSRRESGGRWFVIERREEEEVEFRVGLCETFTS